MGVNVKKAQEDGSTAAKAIASVHGDGVREVVGSGEGSS